ncbi:retinol-binding protein 4 [Tiliqua scincoides]|uniref:retinol-binding protein 4 n=1 Tax=Tiliqua scincoides TaxID=71010 RepID=UPI0034625729
MVHMKGVLLWLVLVATMVFNGRCLAQRDCRVSSFKVQENFDKNRYTGTWYAIAKKDPEGLFLRDNVVATFSVDPNGVMTATARGRVEFLGNWDYCANMVGHFTETEDPAKFKMKYWGIVAQLQQGDDDHWVMLTDYDNYALHYSCRLLNEDGTCADSYSFVFSRTPYGFSPEVQRIIRQKQTELCLERQYRLIAQNDIYPALEKKPHKFTLAVCLESDTVMFERITA